MAAADTLREERISGTSQEWENGASVVGVHTLVGGEECVGVV